MYRSPRKVAYDFLKTCSASLDGLNSCKLDSYGGSRSAPSSVKNGEKRRPLPVVLLTVSVPVVRAALVKVTALGNVRIS